MRLVKTVSILIIVLFLGCATTGEHRSISLSKRNRDKVFNSCYEVLIKKSTVDNLSYEKELPWELVPYNVRNDDYYSIGTG